MPKTTAAQFNFLGGEISPRFQGRVDADIHKNGLAKCENWIVPLQGCAYVRPGTQFIANCLSNTKQSRMVGFEFSVVQAYAIEFGDQKIRFFRNRAQILSGGVPYEIPSPYLEADLDDLLFVQSVDVLFIFHKSYPTMKLIRKDHADWSLVASDFVNGPYLAQNTTTTTLSPSALTGTVTITASSTTGINGGVGFTTDHVGALVQIKHGGTLGNAQITARSSATVVTASVKSAFGGTGASATWSLGAWSKATGFAVDGTFHQDRLAMPLGPAGPQKLILSRVGQYEDLSINDANGTVTSSHAVALELNSSDVQNILAVLSDPKGLVPFTVSGPWVVRAGSSPDSPITPTDVTAHQEGSDGCTAIKPIRVDKAMLFVDRTGKILREIQFYFDQDGFKSNDLTFIADHVTQSGIRAMAFQRAPDPILWCVRNDGQLAAMTYARGIESLRVAWHRHILGGRSNDGGAPTKVESVCVIPGADGSYEVWITAQLFVNGEPRRYVAVFMPSFGQADFQHNAFQVDFGARRLDTFTITAASQTNPVRIATNFGHDFAVGDEVFIGEALGMTKLNGRVFTVSNFGGIAGTVTITIANPGVVTFAGHSFVIGDAVRFTTTGALPTGLVASQVYYIVSTTVNTFTVSATRGGAAIQTTGSQSGVHTATVFLNMQLDEEDGRTYPSYQGGGRIAKRVDTASGLTHLAGEQVTILGDGGEQKATVSTDGAGSIALESKAGFLTAGLPYVADLQTLRLEAGAGDGGPALGKRQKINRVAMLVDKTFGLKIGREFGDAMDEAQERSVDTPAGSAPELFSGIVEASFEGLHSLDATVCIRQDRPLPATLLAILPQLATEDNS